MKKQKKNQTGKSTLNKKKQSRIKKWKIIVSVILVLALITGGFTASFYFHKQPKVVINENAQRKTTQDNKANTGSDGDNSNGANEAVLNENVKVFIEEDADKVNDAITKIQTVSGKTVIEIKNTEGEDFAKLGKGDIFYLEGDDKTPFGETFVGKIASVTENDRTITMYVENPMVDEVFDSFHMDMEQELTADKLTVIDTIEGVTVEKVEDVSADFTNNKSESEIKIDKLNVDTADKADKAVPLAEVEKKFDDIKMNIDVDLSKLFGLKDINNSKNSKKKGNKSKDDTKNIIDKSVTLKGEVGLKDYVAKAILDFDVTKGVHMLQNCGVQLKGQLYTNIEFNMAMQGDLRQLLHIDDTEIELGNRIKCQGLGEKAVPIFFLGYNGGNVSVKISSNKGIENATKAAPVTVALMGYIDVDGNVKIEAKYVYGYTTNFDMRYIAVQDGKFVNKTEKTINEKCDYELGVNVSADMDAHVGASGMVYLYNLNLIDLAVVKLGVEAQGKAEFKVGNHLAKEEIASVEAYARAYLKMGDLKIKFKTKIDLWVVDISEGVEYATTFYEKTLWENGVRKETWFDEAQMDYGQLTAADDEYIFYKDVTGELVKEKDGIKTVIYDGEGYETNEDGSDLFFQICGIDESYLYLMKKPQDGDNYDIYRVSKDGTTSRRILTNVVNCLMNDKQYLYYIDGFDKNTIEKYNRETMKTEAFHKFDHEAQFLLSQNGNYYAITGDMASFAFLLGTTNYYYLLNDKGEILKDYGSDPKESNLYIETFEKYNVADKLVSNGYLRPTASDVYWLNKSKKKAIAAEGISGWNPKEEGIFTTQNNDSGEGYKIVLYSAENGKERKVTNVSNENAFFTLAKGEDSNWYFFDQTDTEIILYKMSNDYSNKTAITKFSREEINYDLESCSTEMRNNRLYFYSIPDNSTSRVLYRYDLY